MNINPHLSGALNCLDRGRLVKGTAMVFLSMAIFVYSFYGCRSTERNEVEASSFNYLPAADYLSNNVATMVGTINSIPVTVNLVLRDSIIYGGYYYNKIGQTLTLLGSWDTNGRCTITERNEKGLITGLFDGGFTKDGLLKGIWENPEGSNKFNFVFQIKTDNREFFGSDSVRLLDCSARGFDFEEGIPEQCDSCISISFKYDSLKSANVTLNKTVNTQLTYLLTRKQSSSLRNYPEIALNTYDDQPYTEEVSLDGVSKSKFGYSFYLFFDYYACGGANPQIDYGFFNFDINSGARINLSDLFVPGFESKLVAIFTKLYPSASQDDYWGINAEELPTIEYLLMENGIVLVKRDDLSGEYYEQFFIDYGSLSSILR